MPRSRDRHGRGIRGPLALPHQWSPKAAPFARPSRNEFFHSCVSQALEKIADYNPDILRDIIVGVEEVPHLATGWAGQRVPMSAALEPSKHRKAQIVVYQRPLERRASSRGQLQSLVYHTIVEQLSALTTSSIEEICGEDPDTWEDF